MLFASVVSRISPVKLSGPIFILPINPILTPSNSLFDASSKILSSIVIVVALAVTVVPVINKLPDTAKQTDMGKSITGQLTFINLAAEKQDIETLVKIIENDENNHQARFDLAICLTAKYDYEQAIEQLLILHQQDGGFQDG